MSANKIWRQYIPDRLNDHLDLHQANLSRKNLMIEKRDDTKQSPENTVTSTSDLTLIVAPIILLVMSGIAFGLDPALMSAPFITSVVDVLGVFIYLMLARAILQI